MPPAISGPGDRRPSREPSLSPIATGKGLRSAAVQDEIFSEYLEISLKVPNLTLPHPYFHSWPFYPTKITAEIDLSDLAVGDAAAVRCMVAVAAEAGGFLTNGGDLLTSKEVNVAVEAGAAVFDSMAAKRRGLVSRFGIGEEIRWYHWKPKEMEPVLEDVPPDMYRTFRYDCMKVVQAELSLLPGC